MEQTKFVSKLYKELINELDSIKKIADLELKIWKEYDVECKKNKYKRGKNMATLSQLASLNPGDFLGRVEIALFERADEILDDTPSSSFSIEEVDYAKKVYQGNYSLNLWSRAVTTGGGIQALDNPYEVADNVLRVAVNQQFVNFAEATA